MLITNHVLQGALVGTLAPGPGSAFALGIASHVVADALRDHLAGLWHDLTVVAGASMLPALVAHDAPVVAAFGNSPTMYSRNAFDAGYGCSLGIPTVMFGPGRRDFSAGMVAAEAVSLSDCRIAAAAYAGAAAALCG